MSLTTTSPNGGGLAFFLPPLFLPSCARHGSVPLSRRGDVLLADANDASGILGSPRLDKVEEAHKVAIPFWKIVRIFEFQNHFVTIRVEWFHHFRRELHSFRGCMTCHPSPVEWFHHLCGELHLANNCAAYFTIQRHPQEVVVTRNPGLAHVGHMQLRSCRQVMHELAKLLNCNQVAGFLIQHMLRSRVLATHQHCRGTFPNGSTLFDDAFVHPAFDLKEYGRLRIVIVKPE